MFVLYTYLLTFAYFIQVNKLTEIFKINKPKSNTYEIRVRFEYKTKIVKKKINNLVFFTK